VGKKFREQFMPTDQQEAETLQVSSKSRLGESLLRLHRRLEESRDEQSEGENLFRIWQMKWFGRRDQISRRLELVESQLQGVPRRGTTTVRLSVFGAPGGDEQTSAAQSSEPAAMLERVTA